MNGIFDCSDTFLCPHETAVRKDENVSAKMCEQRNEVIRVEAWILAGKVHLADDGIAGPRRSRGIFSAGGISRDEQNREQTEDKQAHYNNYSNYNACLCLISCRLAARRLLGRKTGGENCGLTLGFCPANFPALSPIQ
jgi:hypothetical protein